MDYQDVLAAVGAGSAHPGGMNSTVSWMKHIPWQPEMKVLDAGCGTGRTLLTIQQRYGCSITGVDIREAMLKKARKRTELLHGEAVWARGSVEALPLPDDAFDVVITESVNVFVDPVQALQEVYRVSKPSGYYVDVEMFLLAPVPEEWKLSASRVYGVKHVPDLSGWKRYYRKAGFQDIKVLSTQPVKPEAAFAVSAEFPDEIDLGEKNVYKNPKVLEVLWANSNWMESNSRFLGYGIFLCRK
ncbi:class I SAM-dependent methyltransferase [Alicyclobacillus tolerans]|uniref:class I SAM-dependent methyltransferase n=1 Tax=Alicyclobacillus tolerans TaxID=90970 RepID=UPI001F2C7D53|nr:class I SAM-dependent methyltransferase [Alicyclobacillus tolerans]MCF8563707.1 class I SAM-dependent methyltransferase [Alicyclobacillus tolerans]